MKSRARCGLAHNTLYICIFGLGFACFGVRIFPPPSVDWPCLDICIKCTMHDAGTCLLYLKIITYPWLHDHRSFETQASLPVIQ